MPDLYRFTVVVDGNLSEAEFEQLDQEIGGAGTLKDAIEHAVKRQFVLTGFYDLSVYELDVKVTE